MGRHRWSAGAPGGCGRAGGCAADVVVKATMMKETDGSAGRPAAAGRRVRCGDLPAAAAGRAGSAGSRLYSANAEILVIQDFDLELRHCFVEECHANDKALISFEFSRIILLHRLIKSQLGHAFELRLRL